MGKRMKFFMGLFLSLALLQAVFVPFGVGLLTVDAEDFPSWYTPISTKQQLRDIRKDLGGGYYLVNDIVFEEADFQPGGDFYNGGKGWEPIGSFEKPFTGSFHGNGYSIEGGRITANLSSITPGTDDKYIGFFAVNAGWIYDIYLIDWDISVTCNTDTFVGAVCGSNKSGLYSSISMAFINVEYEKTSPIAVAVGGIAGYNSSTIYDSLSLSLVEGSVNAGTLLGGGIVGINDNIVESCTNVGGVYLRNHTEVGKIGATYAGGIAGISNGPMIDCHNYIDVKSESDNVNASAGGIAGICEGGHFRWCSNEGDIFAESRQTGAYSFAGGITGEMYSSGSSGLTESNNKGKITARGKDETYTGGFIGQAHHWGKWFILYENTNVGDVEAISEKGNIFAGGICGKFEGQDNELRDFYDLYNFGNIIGKATSENSDLIIDCYVGGIIGLCKTRGTIVYCINSGTIEGETKSTKEDSGVYTGGLFGSVESNVAAGANWGKVESRSKSNSMSGGIAGMIINVYESSIPYVRDCFNVGEILSHSTGYFAVSGGVVGYGEVIDFYDCYNSGRIKATGLTGSSAVAGGIVGYLYDGYTEYCYNVGVVEKTLTGAGPSTLNSGGGICGYHEAETSILNCYFVDNIKDGVGATDGSGKSETFKKTDAEMKKQSTYKNFDFEYLWFIDPKSDYKYPQLYENSHETITIDMPIKSKSDYRINGDFLIGVRDNTTLEEFFENFESTDSIFVTDKEGEEINLDTIIGTHFELVFFFNGSVIGGYHIVVYGDISGDGKINAADYLMAKRAFMGSIELSPPQMKAACLSGGDTIKAGDYLKIKRHFLGTYDLFYDMLYD